LRCPFSISTQPNPKPITGFKTQTTTTTTTNQSSIMSFFYNCLDSYFKITERNTSLATEFRAGTASFFTLSYLLLVNPQIMAEAGVSHDDAVVATAMSAAVSCFVVGFLGNLPFGTAPGLGLSAYLSYSLVQSGLCSLEDALTACFTSGLVLVIVAL
jgi:adenine/guanine/hypoxanthine permease